MTTPGPAKQVTDEELLDCIKSIDAPFATGKDVATRVGLSAQQCRTRLSRLEKEGLVASKQAGSATGWWVR